MPGYSSNCSGTRTAGFVLPLVLWIIAGLGLVVAAVSAWVSTAVSNAQALRDKVDVQLAVADVRNELIFLLATRPFSGRGLEIGGDLELPDAADIDAIMVGNFSSRLALAFDGRPYAVQSYPDLVIRLQDGRGLLQLNALDPRALDELLAQFDLPETQRNRMIDTLRDYVDEDDLNRLAGAEERDYRLAGLRAPPNQALLTPYQARDVMSWSGVSQLWAEDLQGPLLTTCQSTGFNPNTAPERILRAALPRVTEEGARSIVERRRDKSLRNQREVGAAAGTSLIEEPFFYSFSPGPCTIVDMFHRTSGERVRFSLTMVPFSKVQPWRTDYELRIPRRARGPADEPDPGDVFPTPEAVLAGLGLDD
ncbi:MAG: type II secretion system protein GspK [Rhodospirillaceae bacterium]|nr:type II secretion system protein GspK [Rhodospirillaceae bacterium]